MGKKCGGQSPEYLSEYIVLMFVVYTETFYIYYAMMRSPLAQLIPAIFLAGMLLLINLKDLPDKLRIGPLDLFWIGSIPLFTFSLRYGDAGAVYDVVMYTIGIALVFLLRMKSYDTEKFLKILAAFGVIYAGITIWQALHTEQYMTTIFRLYPAFWQENLRKNIVRGNFAGITNQAASNAGYCLYAIGALVCLLWSKRYQRKRKLLLVCMVMITITGLLLTAKRAHLIFGLMSLLVTYYVAGRHGRNRYIKLALMIGAGATILFILSFMISDLGGTLHRFTAGDTDITSGRFALFGRAWEMFLDHPLIGAGWGQFRAQSAGLLASDVTFEVHNVYLQLLCETGVVGFLFYMIPAVGVYIKTLMCALGAKPDALLLFSVYIQTFILLYSFTGNVLYDYDYLYLYFWVISAAYGYYTCAGGARREGNDR